MKLAVDELNWQQAKGIIYKANPHLAEMLEEFSPNDEYSFILAKYPYGSPILQNGLIYLPTTTGDVIPINHSAIPSYIFKKLSYSAVPMGLITNNSMEVYVETRQRVMPSKLFSSGTFFGLWEYFDRDHNLTRGIWNLSSGARTLFLLPSVSDSKAHEKLRRKYNILEYAPANLLSQIQIFRELCMTQYKTSGQAWTCDVLYFTKKWSELSDEKPSHLRLLHYWLTNAWNQSLNCRNQMDYSVAWELFSNETSRKNWKPKPYSINTIKHLIAITEGSFPGFSPALDESAAPIRYIQDCYLSGYGLKNYIPTVFQPKHIKKVDNYVYYSLSVPTMLEWAPRSKTSSTVMIELREIKRLMDLFINSTGSEGFHFDYFHNENDPMKEIRNASEIPLEDESILHSYDNKAGDERVFCHNSDFFKGCIRIKKEANTLIKVEQ